MRLRWLVAVLCGVIIPLAGTPNQALAEVDTWVAVAGEQVRGQEPLQLIGAYLDKVCGNDTGGCSNRNVFETILHSTAGNVYPACGVADDHQVCTLSVAGNWYPTDSYTRKTLWTALYSTVKASQSPAHFSRTGYEMSRANAMTDPHYVCSSSKQGQEFVDWTIPSSMVATAYEHNKDASGHNPQLGQMSYTITCHAAVAGCPGWLPATGGWVSVIPVPGAGFVGGVISAACQTVDAVNGQVSTLQAARLALDGAAQKVETHQDASTGLCLDSNEQGTAYGLACNGGNYQSWTRRGQTFVDLQTGLCLDSNEQGSVHTQACNGGDYQNWTRRGQTFIDLQTGLCLDSNEQGSVYTQACNGGDYQNWK
jgi:hypothetical protein